MQHTYIDLYLIFKNTQRRPILEAAFFNCMEWNSLICVSAARYIFSADLRLLGDEQLSLPPFTQSIHRDFAKYEDSIIIADVHDVQASSDSCS